MKKLKVGLWGSNGHQIGGACKSNPRIELVCCGAMSSEMDCTTYDNYDAFLSHPGLEFVSLCSPYRSEQAEQAIVALERGIHVYAEKPCALVEADMDRILDAAEKNSVVFHEMAGSICSQPYWEMRRIVRSGEIGEVVQVLAQKSYPFHPNRPTDEQIDGGLIAQCGVHGFRFIEHITGLEITEVQAIQTRLGDAREGSDLQMASSTMGSLSNGGICTLIANYLNPAGFGSWGNEAVRVFGTKGMLETVDGGTRTRLVIGDEDRGSIDTSGDCPDWLGSIVDNILDGTEMPIDLVTELHPTRVALRAWESAK